MRIYWAFCWQSLLPRAVYRAGMYQIDGTVNTVKQLIKKAEGVRGDAFLNRAIIDRENDDLTHEMIQN